MTFTSGKLLLLLRCLVSHNNITKSTVANMVHAALVMYWYFGWYIGLFMQHDKLEPLPLDLVMFRLTSRGFAFDALAVCAFRASDGAEQFIEVKSSPTVSKTFFEMSPQEVKMAQRLSNQYSLYRVSGVGTTSPTLLRIINPIQKWAAGQIKVYVVV